MKKEIIGLFICMLFFSIALFPIVNGIHINTNKKNVINTADEPKIQISLPDVHVYFPESRLQWGTVEFDEPGAIIDVDLSEIEENEVKLIFTQKIICHVEKQLFPALVITSISRPDISASSSFEYIGPAYNWETMASHGYFRVQKAEDETYPLIVAVTGVPLLLKWAVYIYFWIAFFSDLMFDIPSELEKVYGTITEYQLHVHT